METISFEINGQTLEALVGETILQAADRAGVGDIPRLCYKEGYRSDGNCRSCVVEIEGERVLAPSCCYCGWQKKNNEQGAAYNACSK